MSDEVEERIDLVKDAAHVFTLPPGETVIGMERFQDTMLVATTRSVYQLISDEQIGFIVKLLEAK